MTTRIDYFFALASPWTYLGFQRFREIAARHGMEIGYKPVDLLELFSHTGGKPVAQRHPSRQAYRLAELERWKRRLGRAINPAPHYFPVDDSLAKKVLIVINQSYPRKIAAVTEDFHRAIWVENLNLAEESLIRDILYRHVLPDVEIMLLAKSPAAAGVLQDNTAEAFARGVFGVPSYCYREHIFWGQDRLDFLDETLAEQNQAV